jgi:phenylpropionate dioxygenase-like ring-hydroxylating dioxygenase large terminal subunit
MERDLPFTRLKHDFWHLIAHRAALAKPGDFLRLEWFDGEIAAFNDQGDVIVFDNVCPHRGARILSAFDGNQKLRCPYHGWTYRGGKFFAPFPQQFAPSEIAKARYNTLQQAWCGDFLFAAIDPIESLDVQLDGLWPLLINIGRSIYSPFSTNAFDWQSDWRIAIENAIEQYHAQVGLVHPGSFNKFTFTSGDDEFFGRNSVFSNAYSDERTVRQLRRLRRYFAIDHQHEGYQSIFVFPFAMIGSTFGYSYAIQQFFPSAHDNVCKFHSRMLTAKLVEGADPAILAPFFSSSDALNRKVFEEDHAVCARVSPRSLRDDFKPIFAESEVKIARFRKAVREAGGWEY